MHTHRLAIDPIPAESLYHRLGQPSPFFLLESLSVSERFGRLSLAGHDPCLELKADDTHCTLRLLNARGGQYLEFARTYFAPYIVESDAEQLVLGMARQPYVGEEDGRLQQLNTAQVIRQLLQQFHTEEKSFAGLYGALAYRFVYLFEDIPWQHKTAVPHFHLFLYDSFVFFDHLSHTCQIQCTRATAAEAEAACGELAAQVARHVPHSPRPCQLQDPQFTPSEADFIQQVEDAKELFRSGELMEIVLCRRLQARLIGQPYDLYLAYRTHNPSPYLFYFDMGGAEQLIGASPEMMLRHENGKVVLRPISGTAPRGKTPMEDHDNMMRLLNSSKEKAELDMLIDLGRNDLARICEPGVAIEDYRYVEKYKRVMHTVAQVSGTLQAGKTGLDALIASLNAGTLTGAPKLAAMKYIEQMEPFARGYYGGVAGYLALSGEVDTGIIIRSAHIRQGMLEYHSGATLLIDCEPAYELNETRIKAQAFMDLFEPTETPATT